MFLERINRVVLLILCFAWFLFRGRANRPLENANNFLVAPYGKLGDIVCNTPVLRAIREKRPGAKIFVFGDRLGKEILDNAGLVDCYIIRKNFLADLFNIKRAKIDFACITGTSFLDLALLYLAGVPMITVPVLNEERCIQETRPYKILAKCAVRKKFISGNYAPLQYLSLLEPADIYSSDTKKRLAFTEGARKKASEFYRNNNIDAENDFVVGMAPSVNYKIKLWEAEKFAQVADYLSEKYNAKIIIFNSAGDRKISEEMTGYLDKKTLFVDSTGLFNIDELKAAISVLKLFISVDTGTIYIAEAFGVATIDIIGPMDENVQPPTGPRHKIVKLESRKAPAFNLFTALACDYKEARKQIEDITPEMVIKKIDELYG